MKSEEVTLRISLQFISFPRFSLAPRIVIKILCWLLTEMLEVRILPGEPKSLSLINYRVWVEHSVHDRMLGHVKSYVARHIRPLLWRPALCGAGDAVLAREAYANGLRRHIISIRGFAGTARS